MILAWTYHEQPDVDEAGMVDVALFNRTIREVHNAQPDLSDSECALVLSWVKSLMASGGRHPVLFQFQRNLR